MEFKEGHSEDIKVPYKLSEGEETFGGVLCGKGLSVLKEGKASKHSKVKTTKRETWDEVTAFLS